MRGRPVHQTAGVGSRPASPQDDESVVLRVRPHGVVLVPPVLALLLGLAVAGFVAALMPEGRWQAPGRWAVGAVTVAVVVRLAVAPWLRWLSTAFVVTDRRVRMQHGVLRRTSRDVPLSRIADVGVERSVVQRLAGSGTLVLDTVGERGGLVVRDVPRVREVADRLGELLDVEQS